VLVTKYGVKKNEVGGQCGTSGKEENAYREVNDGKNGRRGTLISCRPRWDSGVKTDL
jgi:hypothetical protein